MVGMIEDYQRDGFISFLVYWRIWRKWRGKVAN